MKPEQILQSNFLDILFDNRNKQYGAYTLRRDYNKRLTKALAAMIIFVSATVLLVSWHKPKEEAQGVVPVIYLEDVNLRNPDELVKPKKIEKAIVPSAQKKFEQIDNATYKIVEDDKADKLVHTQDEMDDKLIGSIAVKGDIFDGVPAKPAEIIGKENITGASVAKAPEPEVLTPVFNAQVMPEFPGGKDALMKFMLRHLREPDNLAAGEKLVVLVRFVVNADGNITDAVILKSGGEFDGDVLKVINKMPRWKPGMQDGRFIPVYFQMPVTFVGSEF